MNGSKYLKSYRHWKCLFGRGGLKMMAASQVGCLYWRTMKFAQCGGDVKKPYLMTILGTLLAMNITL